MKRSWTAGVAALLVAGCSGGSGGGRQSNDPRPSTPSSAPTTSSATPQSPASSPAQAGAVKVLVRNLAVPWGVVFLPDGTALVTERDDHTIVRVTAQGTTRDVGTVPGVEDNAGEGGLLGLALSPSFSRDRLVYAYYTSSDDNRVVRFTYDGTRIGTPQTIFTGIPKAGIHNGGRIAFGPRDGYLYVTAGDAGMRERAPDTSYLGGKVLRMTADGKPAPGNPDPSSVVWTKGHRNPQGLAFAPDGSIYEAEFGQSSQDEINLLVGGRDYGWPTVEGTIGSKAGSTAPLITFSTSDASPSGLAYAGGSLWLAALGGERLYRIPLINRTKLGSPQTLLKDGYGRLRTIVNAPDGSLWITTSNRDGRGNPVDGDDRILRLSLQ